MVLRKNYTKLRESKREELLKEKIIERKTPSPTQTHKTKKRIKKE